MTLCKHQGRGLHDELSDAREPPRPEISPIVNCLHCRRKTDISALICLNGLLHLSGELPRCVYSELSLSDNTHADL